MDTQTEIKTVVESADGPELSDLDLVARVLDLGADKKRVGLSLKRHLDKLAARLRAKGVTEDLIGDHRVTIDPKTKVEYDSKTLKSLEPCVTSDQVWLTIRQVGSGKQLKALSDLGGASAKAVIASAKGKIETGETVVKIKKPRKPRAGKQRRH